MNLLILSSSSLQPCITKPTRIVSYNRPSLVDNIFISEYDKTILSGNVLDKITDHLPKFIIIKNLSLKPWIKNIRIRDMKNFNQEKYIQGIKELDNLNFHLYKGVNTMFIVFQNKLIEIIDSNASYITLSKKQSKLRHKPWITSSILKSIKNKTLYCKKFMKRKNKFWFDRYQPYIKLFVWYNLYDSQLVLTFLRCLHYHKLFIPSS